VQKLNLSRLWFDASLGQYASSKYIENFSVEPTSAIRKDVEVLWPEKETGELELKITLSSGKNVYIPRKTKVGIN
jgi:hypothetical protein